MRKIILTILTVVLASGVAAAGAHALNGDALSPVPVMEERMHFPTILDMIHRQELITYSNDLWFKTSFADQWTAVGCEVEDRSEPMGRVICPGFRVDPKVKEVVAPQWFIADLLPPTPTKEPKKVRSELEGKI